MSRIGNNSPAMITPPTGKRRSSSTPMTAVLIRNRPNRCAITARRQPPRFKTVNSSVLTCPTFPERLDQPVGPGARTQGWLSAQPSTDYLTRHPPCGIAPPMDHLPEALQTTNWKASRAVARPSPLNSRTGHRDESNISAAATAPQLAAYVIHILRRPSLDIRLAIRLLCDMYFE